MSEMKKCTVVGGGAMGRQIALNTAIRQFEFVDVKILGVVFNCINEHSGRYGERYYRKYYRKYYNRYYRGYASAKAYEMAASENKTES